MNKGLKQYTKQLTQTVGNVTGSININKEDSNLHITVPLISTTGLNPIETSLIFNLQDKDKTGLFGKGFKLNFYKLLQEETDKITLTNSDGSIDEYLSSNNYFNSETQMRAYYEFGDYEDEDIFYVVNDKLGNKLHYTYNHEYPSRIEMSSGENYYLNFSSSTKTISNGHGDVITFTLNEDGLVTVVEYKHNDTVVSRVNLSYTNGMITDVQYKTPTTISSRIKITMNSTTFVVIDSISKHRIKYVYSGNRVTSFVDSYSASYDNNRKIDITYYDNKTMISDYKGKKHYYFFDSQNFPIYEIDNDYNAVKTKYNKITKSVISQSSNVPPINRFDNLLANNSVSGFTLDGVTLEKVDCTDEVFSELLGDSVYKVTGTEGRINTLTYTILTNGIATDNVSTYIWGKQLTPYDEDHDVNVSLYLGNRSYSYDTFNKETLDDLYELIAIGATPEESYDRIDIVINVVGNASILLGGVQVLKKQLGSFYNYDSNNNLTSTSLGHASTSIGYSSNLPSSIVTTDSTICKMNYDTNKNLTQAQTSYGVQMENVYDTAYKHNLLTSKVSNRNQDKILKVDKTYTSDGRFVSSEVDELGNTTTYSNYDSFGRVGKIVNALDASLDYTYNTDTTLKKDFIE